MQSKFIEVTDLDTKEKKFINTDHIGMVDVYKDKTYLALFGGSNGMETCRVLESYDTVKKLIRGAQNETN